LACRVGLEFLKILQEENLLQRTTEIGEYFKEKLLGLKAKYPFISDVRGEGLILGAELTFPCREIVNRCLEAGFIINCTSDKVLRFLPPYVITKKEINQFIKALDKIFLKVQAETPVSHPLEQPVGGGH
jgi:acetylornithine/succinyldiaminopimelate/putrescine aminotransferase